MWGTYISGCSARLFHCENLVLNGFEYVSGIMMNVLEVLRWTESSLVEPLKAMFAKVIKYGVEKQIVESICSLRLEWIYKR